MRGRKPIGGQAGYGTEHICPGEVEMKFIWVEYKRFEIPAIDWPLFWRVDAYGEPSQERSANSTCPKML